MTAPRPGNSRATNTLGKTWTQSRRFSAEEDAQLKALNKTMRAVDIAKIMDRSVANIRNRVAYLKLNGESRGHKWVEEEYGMLIKLRKQGHQIKVIARMMNRTPFGIKAKLQQLGKQGRI